MLSATDYTPNAFCGIPNLEEVPRGTETGRERFSCRCGFLARVSCSVYWIDKEVYGTMHAPSLHTCQPKLRHL